MQSIQPRRLVLTAALACAPVLLAGASWASEDGDYTADAQKLFTHAMGNVECAPTDEHECGMECEESYNASAKLRGLLVRSPEAFEEVAPMFRASFEQGGASRDKALGFLTSCGSDGCVAMGDELFAAAPKSFTDVQMLAFAEGGSEVIEKELAARVKARKCESILPAAWFAFRGDAVGKSSLKKAAAAKAVDPDNVVEVLVAAGALSALGDEKALPAAQARVHAAVLTALDAGELDSARAMTLSASLLREPIEKGVHAAGKGYGKQKVKVSSLEEELGWYRKKNSEQLASADAVFELIESITPLS